MPRGKAWRRCPKAWAAELDRRFNEACRAAQNRLERRQLAKQSAERLPTLVPEIEAIAEKPDYNDVRSQWYALRKQWQAIARDVEIDADLKSRFEAASQKLEAKEQTFRDAKGQQQTDNLQRLQAILQKFETRAAAEGLTLKQTDQLMKEVKLAVGTMGPLPTKQDREDLMVRLQAVRTSLTPRIQELREAEEWKRWANVQVQEELCTKMEALVPLADTDPEKASNEMRTLQERWKPVAAAPRSQAEALWTRFKAAQEQVYEKCKDFFAQQATERVENLKKKEALCARAESMADSTDWVKTADAMKSLQAEWKAVGPVTRGNEKAVWERFRAACDRFFTRRQEDLKQRKQDWTENLKRKEALVAEAKQLSESTEWEQAASRIKRLQADWKTIGPVKKSKSDAIWNEFRAACDLFFERFKNRDQVALQGKMADRESAVNELEALLPPADAADAPQPDDLYAKVQAARARWVQGPELPRHTLAPLAERVNAALFSLVTRWPERLQGHRHRSRADQGQDGEAHRQGRKTPADRKRRAGEEPVARGAARAAVARSAGRQHHGRRRRPPGRRRASARRRTGSAQRAGGVGAPGPAGARRAQAAAGSFRSRRSQVPRDAPAVDSAGVMLSELVLRVRHAIYRTFAEGGVPRSAALSAQLNIPLDDIKLAYQRLARGARDRARRAHQGSVDGAAVLGRADAASRDQRQAIVVRQLRLGRVRHSRR